MEEKQIIYKYCLRSLGLDFTDEDLCYPGDVIKIPEENGIFEVVNCYNIGDFFQNGVYFGASTWYVTAKKVDYIKRNIKDITVKFHQKYKNNTEKCMCPVYRDDIQFINKKNGNDRRKFQDIFLEVENNVKEENIEDYENYLKKNDEIYQIYMDKLNSNLNSAIIEILGHDFVPEQVGKFITDLYPFEVLINYLSEVNMKNDDIINIVRKNLPKKTELDISYMKLAVINQMKELKKKFDNIENG
jgi:hypothetical protein